MIKNRIKMIIIVIIGIIIVSSISVYATYNYLAGDICYIKSDGTEVNVESALNELYEGVNHVEFYINTFRGNGSNSSGVSIYGFNYPEYKYYKISQTSTGTSTSYSIQKRDWTNNGATTNLQFDTKYEFNHNNNEEIFFTPNTGYRVLKIELFKN